MDNRVHFQDSFPIKTAFGSTFATNKLHRIDAKGDHILDATYGGLCPDQGYALAIGDGSGGHFGDEHQDKRIWRAAHFASKACVRFLAAYSSPDQLKADFNKIIDAIKKEVQRKAVGESTTLACCRTFPMKEGSQVVGLNIGDNMVIAWDPKTNKLTNLLPSRCSEVGTALIPGPCKPFEIEVLDVLVPHGTRIMFMTDGMYDTLPYVEEGKTYPNGLSYKVRALKEDLFEGLHEDQSNPELKRLMERCFEGAEQQRLAQKEPNVQIGDDLSVILCRVESLKTLSNGA